MSAAYKHWLDGGPGQHDPWAAAATTVDPAIGPAIGARPTARHCVTPAGGAPTKDPAAFGATYGAKHAPTSTHPAAFGATYGAKHAPTSTHPAAIGATHSATHGATQGVQDAARGAQHVMPSGPTPAYAMRPSASPLWSPRAALFEVLSADSAGGPGTMRTAEPSFDVDAARFIGATIRLFDAEVLVVRVVSRVLGDRAEAPALVAAFGARFRRTIVLVAQDRRGVPTYFGPGPIAAVLARMPFDALPWRRYRYRPPRPQMLPIPTEPLPSYETDYGDHDSCDHSDIGANPMRDDGAMLDRAIASDRHRLARSQPAECEGSRRRAVPEAGTPVVVDRTVAGHRKRDAQEVARRTRTLPPG